MKAIVQEKYGPPDDLRLVDIAIPEPKDDEVLVRIRAASVNPADWHCVRGLPLFSRLTLGLTKPKNKIPGRDVAGTVEKVGASVSGFQPGDEVYAEAGFGSFAEYVSVSQELIAPKPSNVSFEQAAAVPLAAVTALQGLRDAGKVQSGQKVLIVGASGGVGTFAVQIAKWMGAEVTGVCSTKNLELVRSLGADHVIDYTQGDYTKAQERYDVIFQLGGTQPASELRRVLTPKGILVQSSGEMSGANGPMGRIIRAALVSPFVGQKLGPFLAKPSKEDLHLLSELLEQGKVTPVIDRTYGLSEVPEAVSYVESAHARGKVVISLS
jgi:NADPH:quinone reductase-like Zn-dependent oxidoreductase